MKWIAAAFYLVLALSGVLSPPAGAQQAPAYKYARPGDPRTALDRYVAKPDAAYEWKLVQTQRKEGYRVYTLRMTSQAWRSPGEVSRTLWWHWVAVCVPDQVAHRTALLLIDGGFNEDAKPGEGDRRLVKTACENGVITATLYQVPNQSLYFTDMKGWPRFEDSLIAYTWLKALKTGDPEWLLRFPMTKAAVRAMDTVQAFCAAEAGGGHPLDDFFVVGGSKRGWATWTTAIVDKRVSAIAPLSIEPMNFGASVRHHYASLGKWSAFLGDYLALNLMDWLDTPEFNLLKEIDPYAYRDRLTLPKYIMYGANDQFFLPGTTPTWWPGLKGGKWLRQIPNAHHALDETAAPSVMAFFVNLLKERPLPVYDFTYAPDGSIEVLLKPSSDGEIRAPQAVKFWQGWNPEARDARGSAVLFEATDLAPASPGVYRAKPDPKERGYQFYLIELIYPGPAPDLPLRFTSGCRISPEETPYEYVPPEALPKGYLSNAH